MLRIKRKGAKQVNIHINTHFNYNFSHTIYSKLTIDDFEDGTFSVSSVGNLGGTLFVPTILRPQGAIVAIGKAKTKASYVGVDGDGKHEFEPRDYIGFSFSCDHRVIDGATCARFSENIRKLIEDPQNMLLSMS